MIQNIFKLSYLAIGLLFIISCGEDSVITDDPIINFSGSTGGDITVKAGETFIVSLSASKKDAELNGLEIRENGSKVDASRILFKGNAVSSNPILITGTDRTSFANVQVSITSGATVGVTNYEFIIIDQDNKNSSVTKKVTIDVALPATVTFNGTSPVFANLNQFHLFNFSVLKGSGNIITVEVKQAGITILDASRLEFEGVGFTTNPNALASVYQVGFTSKNIGVRMPNVAGDYELTFIFGDEIGTESEVKVIAKVGTALSLNKAGVIFNFSGPNNGSLDLDTGDNLASSSTDSEIQDLGINNDVDLSKNWLQQIKGENGTELRLLKLNDQIEATYEFDNLSYKEEIVNKLWANGLAITSNSPKLQVGWIFAVKKGNKYYAFEVKDIIVTPNNNEDYYEFSIKW